MARVLFVGRTTLDAVYTLDRLPDEDTKCFAEGFMAAPGGPAVNAALTCARLGGEALLITAVGAGPWAGLVRAALQREGVRLLDLAAGTGYQTPLTTVLSAPNQRTIVNPPIDRTPVRRLEGGWARSVPADWGPAPAVALSDGFFVAETLDLLADCRRAGTLLAMDGGSWKPGLERLTPLLTAAVVGERFSPPGAEPRPEPVFEYFSRAGVPCIGVTRGPKPILASERGRRFEIGIEPVEGAETLGAGDVLHGALAHYLAEGLGFEDALRRAARVATASCRGLGTEFRQRLS